MKNGTRLGRIPLLCTKSAVLSARGFARSLGARDAENLSGAISWLTFLLQPKAL
jgi:hypothetical protein